MTKNTESFNYRRRMVLGLCCSAMSVAVLAGCSDTDKRTEKKQEQVHAVEQNTPARSEAEREGASPSHGGSLATVTLPDGTRLDVSGDAGSFSAVLQRGNETEPLFTARAKIPNPGEGGWNWGDYSLIRREAPGRDDQADYRLRYMGRDVAGTEGRFSKVEARDTWDDIPLPGCATRSIEAFTGGANCCTGYYLLTRCADSQTTAFVPPFAGTMAERPQRLAEGMTGVAVDDPAFLYFEPSGQRSGASVSLSRAESPRLTRFLVFADGAWRIDRPGDLPETYADLAIKAGSDASLSPAAQAISVAYYRSMVGDGESDLRAHLRQSLPLDWAPYADGLAATIAEATSSFDPLKRGK